MGYQVHTHPWTGSGTVGLRLKASGVGPWVWGLGCLASGGGSRVPLVGGPGWGLWWGVPGASIGWGARLVVPAMALPIHVV